MDTRDNSFIIDRKYGDVWVRPVPARFFKVSDGVAIRYVADVSLKALIAFYTIEKSEALRDNAGYQLFKLGDKTKTGHDAVSDWLNSVKDVLAQSVTDGRAMIIPELLYGGRVVRVRQVLPALAILKLVSE